MAKTVEEIASKNEEIHALLPGAKAILLTGYKGNQDYTRAKAPKSKGWGRKTFSNYEPPSDLAIQKHLDAGGWIGAALAENITVVDIDPIKDAEGEILTKGHELGSRLYNLLKDNDFSFHAILTPNGMQFIFKSAEDSGIKNEAKAITPLGLPTDYRTDGGQIVFPTENTDGRHFIHISDRPLDEVPFFLLPLERFRRNKDGDPNHPIYPIQEGQRNNEINRILFNTRRSAGEKLDNQQLTLIGEYVNQYFTDPPIEDMNELHATIRSVIGAKIEKRMPVQTSAAEDFDELPSAATTQIPKPYQVVSGALFRITLKEKRGELIEVEEMVCRQAPIITRSFSNVERSQLYYELEWTDHGRVYNETVPAGSLAVKRDLLQLADMSLAVNDLNAKHLIDYFDKYITYNRIPREHLVERLGHVKGEFIHPLLVEKTKIMPGDVGEKQIMEAFQVQGTANEWIENVFNKIEDHPKAVLMVLASFTSVILKDLKLSPFIVDLSGPTSRGKTTALKAAASVWGSGHLVSEWNLTKVAAERKAAFLNSFPLYLDDSMKADEKHLKAFVYNFSGGRSKGRGSIAGSQVEYTWNNLMLSTGETSLTDYAMQAGGAAARVLPVTGLPFEKVEYGFFNELYGAIDDYHGAIGIDFLKHWRAKSKDMLPLYQKYNEFFQKQSEGNEVLSRIARHYAAIVFTGKLLKEFFGIDINSAELTRFFAEMSQENKATDKPKQLLENILSDLDADRKSIAGRYDALRDLKAIYKDETLFLLPAYVKEMLQTENLPIRKEWRRRGLTLSSVRESKEVDYRVIAHGKKRYKAIPVDPAVIEELGFDFSEDEDEGEFSVIPR